MMKVLLEFKPEDVIKVFNPFFQKPYAQKILYNLDVINRINTLEEFIQTVIINGGNEKIKFFKLNEFIKLPEHLPGTYAIKLVSLVKKYITNLNPLSLDEIKISLDLRHDLPTIVALFTIFSYINAKNISIPDHIKQFFQKIMNATDLNQIYPLLKNSPNLEEYMKKIGVAIQEHNIKMIYKPIYEDAFWAVYEVNTHKEACVVGGNSRWCVSSSSGEEHLAQYKKRGDRLYAFLSKNNREEKYMLAVAEWKDDFYKVLKVKEQLDRAGFTNDAKTQYIINNILSELVMNELKDSLSDKNTFLSNIVYDKTRTTKTNILTQLGELQEGIENIAKLPNDMIADFNYSALFPVLINPKKNERSPTSYDKLLNALASSDWNAVYLEDSFKREFVTNHIDYTFFNVYLKNAKIDLYKIWKLSRLFFNYFNPKSVYSLHEIIWKNFIKKKLFDLFYYTIGKLEKFYYVPLNYELADINNTHMKYDDLPLYVRKVVEKVLPKYVKSGFFDMNNESLHSYMSYLLVNSKKTMNSLSARMESDFINENKNSSYMIVREYFKLVEENDNFRKILEEYHGNITNVVKSVGQRMRQEFNRFPHSLFNQIFEHLESNATDLEASEIEWAEQKSKGAIKEPEWNVWSNRAFWYHEDLDAYIQFISKDFLNYFNEHFAFAPLDVHFEEYDAYNQFDSKTKETMIKNITEWITATHHHKDKITILLQIIFRDLLLKLNKQNKDFIPENLIDKLKEIIDGYFARS